MLGFDKARAAGADGIELDVRLDGGGNVVVGSLNDRKIMEVNPEGKAVWEAKVEGGVYRIKHR